MSHMGLFNGKMSQWRNVFQMKFFVFRVWPIENKRTHTPLMIWVMMFIIGTDLLTSYILNINCSDRRLMNNRLKGFCMIFLNLVQKAHMKYWYPWIDVCLNNVFKSVVTCCSVLLQLPMRYFCLQGRTLDLLLPVWNCFPTWLMEHRS